MDKKTLAALALILVVVILPTGDPSDLVTFWLFAWLGSWYWLVALGVIAFYFAVKRGWLT